MAHSEHHERLVKELAEMLAPVFENSPQAIYLYLDDEHKICNQKFADLVGYSSVEEWVANQTPVDDVAEEDRDKIIEAYGKASENYEASERKVKINKKDGSEVEVKVIMVPLTYQGETFVLHFIEED